MNNVEILFKKYLSANGGNKESMWFIIKRFEKYIDYECNGNLELKHVIIVDLFDFAKVLDVKFDEYYKDIIK